MADHDPILKTLPAILATVDRSGDFYGTGAVDLPVVRLSVDGVGPISLPIPPAQAEALRAVSVAAPYGRGTRTLVDEDVRRCGQVEPAAVHADDPRWGATLDAIVADAKKSLGVTGAVSAELYKLLVYGPGDFFVEHRDTEKEPGMFATLVVSLPCAHQGGELVVQHEGREVTLSLASDDVGAARWAAFYCDCVHELRPITEGYRVALVYNLARRAKKPVRAPESGPAVKKLSAALTEWAAREGAPALVVVPLSHRYSLAEVDFQTLKNGDAAVAQALTRAAEPAGCTLRLAVLSIAESGSAEPTWDGYSRRRRYDEEASESYEVVEVIERQCTLRAWRAPDGGREDYGEVEVDEETEVAPPGALEDAEPDEDQLHEATGNGGASFERTYRWAALVLWPNAREREVLAHAGAEALLAAIERRARSDKDGALSLARYLTSVWKTLRKPRARAALHVRATRLFLSLGDDALLAELLDAIASAGGLSGVNAPSASFSVAALDDLDDDLDDEDLDDDERDEVPPPRVAAPTAGGGPAGLDAEVEATVAALTKLPGDVARRVSVALVTARGGEPLTSLARVLHDVAVGRGDDAMTQAVEALSDAVVAMEKPGPWNADVYPTRVVGIAELLRAASAAGGALLAQRASRAVVAAPTAPLDRVLVPVALALHASPRRPTVEAVAPLLDACRAHLEARVALPLERPRDATREVDGLTCKCADCASLKAFLRDPVKTRWELKANEQLRRHVAEQARQAHVDVSTKTVTTGRPYTLVCTKTTARYDARVRQRADDTAALAALKRW